MPDTHADFVIHISTSAAASLALGAAPEGAAESQLIRELQRSLQPGAEIVFSFGAYVGRTSILWLSSLEQDSSFRVGMRLLGISGRADGDYSELLSEEEQIDRPARARAAHLSH